MSSDTPTLATGPMPHLAMDYAALRAEGIALLARLASPQWTDFNDHDPGITILEQLCYAITDLGYRTNFPVADLLAASADPGLPDPADILTCSPVTPEDLRKAVRDLGVGAVRIEEAGQVEPAVYHHPGSGELRFVAAQSQTEIQPIRLRGVQRVLVQTTEQLSGDAALSAVSSQVHRHRALGEDREVGHLTGVTVWVWAQIEIGPVEDPVETLAEIVECVEGVIHPPARYATQEEQDLDTLYQGPRLQNGWIVELPEPRHAVATSDLLRAILDVQQVRAVRSIAVSFSSAGPRERWFLPIPAGSVARLALDSELTLLRAGLPLQVDAQAVRRRLVERRRARATSRAVSPEHRPPGRRRNLTQHRSVQRQLPRTYGVGPAGLPLAASSRRRAAAKQLAAYLLIFDQLLANAFAQLGRAHELLSPASNGGRTLFSQPVIDPPLDLAGLLRIPPEELGAWLDDNMGDDRALDRRRRFLSHLLARFGEEIGDHAHMGGLDAEPDAIIIADREAFLQDISSLSSARGSGFDLWSGEVGGLEKRIRLKLGSTRSWRFHVIEHVLLRPLPEDRSQIVEAGEEQIPLLAGVSSPDPWSLQVSFVFEDRDIEPHLERYVAQVIASETPAHLAPRLLWFGREAGDHWRRLDAAWTTFRAHLQDYRRASPLSPSVDRTAQLALRDARDRVIELLEIGRPWPLRDVPLPTHLIVVPDQPGEITLGFSQSDVRYQLREEETGDFVMVGGHRVIVKGTGGEIALPRPGVAEDALYRVLAVKVKGSENLELRRQTWLHGTIRIEVGIDKRLLAQLLLPALDPSIDEPKPGDARIADWGSSVTVEVHKSQEGVSYELISASDAHKPFAEQHPLSAVVVGTSGTIRLTLPQATEDIDLRVRGSRAVGDPSAPERREGVLDANLLLRVRANPGARVRKSKQTLDFGEAGSVFVLQSQESVHYQLFARPVRDIEFVFTARPAGQTLVVLDAGRRVRVRRPQPEDLGSAGAWSPLTGEVGGTGGPRCALPFAPPAQDLYLAIQASKRHAVTALSNDSPQWLTSTVWLEGVRCQLVRPDPEVELRLFSRNASGQWQVLRGQSGVVYTLRQPDGTVLDRPAFFHQRDDRDDRFNKGVGQLRIERDLAIARGGSSDTARHPPPPPLLDLSEAPQSGVVTVHARKAMSGVSIDLSGHFTLLPRPSVRVEPALVSPGQSATVIVGSVAGVRYVLLRDGTAVSPEQAGTGGDLSLDSGPITESVDLIVRCVRQETLWVEQVVPIRVEV